MQGSLFDLDGRTTPTRAPAGGVSRLGRGLSPDGPWFAWHVATGMLLVGLVSAEVALNQAVEGAASPAERSVLGWSMALAVVLIPAGLAARARLSGSCHRRTRASASTDAWLATAAGVFELVRASWFATRLADHVRLDRDEPLTTITIALQLVVALAFTAGLAAFALGERRRGRAA